MLMGVLLLLMLAALLRCEDGVEPERQEFLARKRGVAASLATASRNVLEFVQVQLSVSDHLLIIKTDHGSLLRLPDHSGRYG
jgi:hypothetical protein